MKLKTNFKVLLIFGIILVAMLLFGTTKVNANVGAIAITEYLDIATGTQMYPDENGNDTEQPSILKAELEEIEVKELVRGKTYTLWELYNWEQLDNCTLLADGKVFGTLEKTDTKLVGDFQLDGIIQAYTLKVDKDAVLPAEKSGEYDEYILQNDINDELVYISGHITLVDEESLKENTITNNDDNNDVKVGITGKISSNAKVVLKEISETANEFKTMQTSLTSHITEEFSQYNNKVLFVKDIKIEDGKFDGKLTLTFDVGTEYNKNKFVIVHQKSSDNKMEFFNGVVADGKATIEVTELSPFAVSVLTEKEVENTTEKEVENTKEKDDTPKTGTVDIINYVVVMTVLAGVGIVAVKKKLK